MQAAARFGSLPIMLLKDIDDKTPDLGRLQELLVRSDLSPRQRDDIFKQMDNIRTGYRGERDAAFFLNDSFGDRENTILIHDLRLEHGGRVAQIDHLLINRFRRVYVLETKSLNANLACNEAGEWTAWYGSGKRGIPQPIASPIEQARRHVSVLDSWFKANGLKRIERIEPVVIVSPTSFVAKTRARGDEDVPVVRADLFERWWLNVRNSGGENLIGGLWRVASAFSVVDLIKIGELLVANHRPLEWDWAARFGVKADAPSAIGTALSPAAALPKLTELPEPASASAAVEPSVAAIVAMTSRSGDRAEACTDPVFPNTPPADADATHVEVEVTAIPDRIETPFGVVAVKRVTVGQYALRHAVDERLSEHVRQVAQGRGRWQRQYRNWLVSGDHIATIAAELRVAKSS